MAVAEQLPNGSTGIKLLAIRSQAETGIELQVGFTKEWSRRSGSQQMWDSSALVVVDRKVISNSTGGCSLEYATTRKAYSDFAEAVESALKSPPRKTIEISYSLIKDE